MTRTPPPGGRLTDVEEAVLTLIEADDVVALASALIAAPSENPGGTEAATVAALAKACEAAGLHVGITELVAGRENLTATLPGGPAPGVMFLGHSDVVPAGPGWSRHPFEPVVADGRLYGRGATDMKGGLAAIVVALAALRRAGVALTGPVQLVCTADEEEHGLGIRSFSRSAGDRKEAAAGFRACIVAEPTDLDTVIGCRGDSYLDVIVTGRAAHSGRPADGRNAINAAAQIIGLIEADGSWLARDPDPLLGNGTWNVGLISGGQGTAVVSPECRISLDRRLLPGEDPARIATELAAQISAAGIDADGIEVRVDVSMEMPGFRLDADHPLPTAAVAAVADGGGVVSTIGGWSAACDGGFVARDLGVDTIVLGPGGINDQAHRPDESVGLDELLAAARAYALICLRLLAVEESVPQRTPANQ